MDASRFEKSFGYLPQWLHSAYRRLAGDSGNHCITSVRGIGGVRRRWNNSITTNS